MQLNYIVVIFSLCTFASFCDCIQKKIKCYTSIVLLWYALWKRVNLWLLFRSKIIRFGNAILSGPLATSRLSFLLGMKYTMFLIFSWLVHFHLGSILLSNLLMLSWKRPAQTFHLIATQHIDTFCSLGLCSVEKSAFCYNIHFTFLRFS